MNKAAASFALVAVLAASLMALSLAVARHGYPFGVTGVKRLDGIASADTFMPLAAIYFFAAMLMMILPLKAASIVLLNAADTIHWVVITLFATIVGCLAARWAFGQASAPWALLDWRFLFVIAIVAGDERTPPQRPAAQPVLRPLRPGHPRLPVLVVPDLKALNQPARVLSRQLPQKRPFACSSNLRPIQRITSTAIELPMHSWRAGSANVFQAKPIQGPAGKPEKLRHGVDVRSLRCRLQIADCHVLDHLIAQRAHLGPSQTPVLKVALQQPQSFKTEASSADPRTKCRVSGFVQSQNRLCVQ